MVRKRHYDIDALYDPSGVYGAASGIGGYNWNGIVALLVGGVAGALNVDISWIVGLPVGLLVYLGLHGLGIQIGAKAPAAGASTD